MKQLTVLAFLALLGGCSSTTVYKTTLTETSNASENVRSEDVAFCMRTARQATERQEEKYYNQAPPDRSLADLFVPGVAAAKQVMDTSKAVSSIGKNGDPKALQAESKKLFHECLIEKGYEVNTEAKKR